MLKIAKTSKEATAMKELIKRLGDSVVGVASGFDRIVFQGMLRPLMYADGAMDFFRSRGILFKDSRDWVMTQTKMMATAVENWSIEECGEGITYLPSSRTRKEDLARRRQQDKQIVSGLIGTWSCVEAGGSYRLVPADGAPRLRYVQTRCKHLYSYLDHPTYGFMSLRIQTWFPYRIQIALNGREWLARQLERAGIGFERRANKVFRVDDLDAMQSLLDEQVRTNWCRLLNSFVPVAFPTFHETLDTGLSYTWTLWQSEWASDVLFADSKELDSVMEAMIRHAFIGAHPDRLLRYFGRRTNKDGRPRRYLRDNLRTTVLDHDEGCRIRHWHGRNSVKLYNERNVLRFETTINEPSAFRVYRRKQGSAYDAPKQLLPLRKGVADTTLRARVSQEINDRLADHMAATRSAKSFESLLEEVTKRKRRRRRAVRAVDPTGKDRNLLRAIADPNFTVAGFANKDLRLELAETHRFRGKTRRQASSMVSRAIRLLRDHSLVRRLPKSRRYQLTKKGRLLVTTLQAALAASTEQLTRMAA